MTGKINGIDSEVYEAIFGDEDINDKNEGHDDGLLREFYALESANGQLENRLDKMESAYRLAKAALSEFATRGCHVRDTSTIKAADESVKREARNTLNEIERLFK